MKKIGKFIGKIAGFALGGPLGLVAASAIGGKKRKTPTAPNPTTTIPQRDEARARVDVSRGLLRRRGGADDILFGAGGLEPMSATGMLGLPGGQ